MRQAFLLLGVMTLIISVGALVAFERAEAPSTTDDQLSLEGSSSNTPETMQLTLTSPAFTDGGSIPSLYTCDGKNVSPQLSIGGAPEGTRSLVLVMDDPDIPDSVKQARGIEKFDHWVLYNIPADTTVINEGAILGTTGLNSMGESAYTGPCPPDREHRYIFRLYAISGTLNFFKAPTLDEVEVAAQGMALASTTLTGRYNRTPKD